MPRPKTPPRPAARKRPSPTRDLSLFVEVLPGIWQPQEMTAAERWKQQMRRKADGRA